MQTSETTLEKSEAAIFGRVFTNGKQALSRELARQVLGLTFGEQDKARMHDLIRRAARFGTVVKRISPRSGLWPGLICSVTSMRGPTGGAKQDVR